MRLCRSLVCCPVHGRVGDIDNDGDNDIVFVNGGGLAGLRLAWNDGSGRSFVAMTVFQTCCNRLYDIALADWDRDGDLDVTATTDFSFFSVWRYNGVAGALASPVSFSGPCTARVLGYSDFDKDGDVDIFAACLTDVYSVANIGSPGTLAFATPVAILAGSSYGNYRTGVTNSHCDVDFSNDGWVDCVLHTVSHVMLLYSSGPGTFAYASPILASSNTISAGPTDFDKDGRAELVISYFTNIRPAVYTARHDANFIDNSTFTFRFGSAFNMAYDGSWSNCIGDLDKDGYTDIVFTGRQETKAYLNTDGKGPASWHSQAPHFVGAAGGDSPCSLADIDTDGDLDVVGIYNFIWMPTTGYSEFTVVNSSAALVAVLVAEVTGDLVEDVVALDSNGTLYLAAGSSEGGGAALAANVMSWQTGMRNVSSVVLADVALGDGVLDLVMASQADGIVLLPIKPGGNVGLAARRVLVTSTLRPRLICSGCGDVESVVFASDSAVFRWHAGVTETLAANATFTRNISVCLCALLDSNLVPDLIWGSPEGLAWLPDQKAYAVPLVNSPLLAGAPFSGLDVCDINGDSITDLVFSRNVASGALAIGVLMQSAGGAFDSLVVNVSFSEPRAQRVRCVDNTGDGLPEIAVLAAQRMLWYSLPNVATLLALPLSAHVGAVGVAAASMGPAVAAVDAALADTDLNTALDFVVADARRVRVFESRSLVAASLVPSAMRVSAWPHLCGFSIACLRSAIARAAINTSPAYSAGTVPTIAIPAGRFYGCFAEGALELTRSIIIEGAGANLTTIACTPGVGGVFARASGAATIVRITNLTLDGTTTVRTARRGTSALRASDGALLVLAHVHVVRADATQKPLVIQIYSGYGAAVFVETLASLDAVACVFTHNIARFGGGALAAVDPLSITITASRFAANAAAGGHGGAVSVTVSPTVTASVKLVVRDCVFEANTAGPRHAGGAVHTLGAFSIELNSTIVERNSAQYGGALAFLLRTQLPEAGVFVPTMLAPAESGTVPAGAGAMLHDIVATSNSASYGGLLLVCELPVTVGGPATAVTDSHASVAGDLVFVCLPVDVAAAELLNMRSTAAGVQGSLGLGPWVAAADAESAQALLAPGARAAGSSAYGTAAGVASAALSLEFRFLPELGIVPGAALADTSIGVVARDAFGSAVRDPATLVSLSVVLGASAYSLAGVTSAALADDIVGFPLAALQVAGSYAASVAQTVGAMDLGSVTVAVELANTLTPARTESRAFALLMCGRGQGNASGSADEPFVCASCPDRYAQEHDNTTASCKACPAGSQSTGPGAGTCAYCPPNATPYTDARGDQRCACLEGFFSQDPSSNSAPCVPCPRRDSCVAGSLCAVGSDARSLLCKDCEPQYYSDSSGRCRRCPASRDTSLSAAGALVIVLLLGGAVALISSWTAARVAKAQRAAAGATEYVIAKTAMRKTVGTHPLSAAIMLLQILSFIGSADWKWPSSTRTMTESFGMLFAFDTSLLVSECQVRSAYTKFALAVSWPIAALVVSLIVGLVVVSPSTIVCSRACSRFERVQLVSLVVDAVTIFGPVLYLPLSRTTFTFFDCIRLPDGRFYMDLDPGVQCYTASWKQSLPVAVAALVLYVVGIPCMLAGLLVRYRDRLYTDPVVFVRHGALYKAFRERYAWGEVILLIKRLWITIAIVFFTQQLALQFLSLFTVFFMFVVLHAKLEPFVEPLHNSLELHLNIGVTVLLFFGISFAQPGLLQSSSSRTAFEVLANATVVALLVRLAVAFVMDVRRWHALRKAKHQAEAATGGSDSSLVADLRLSDGAELLCTGYTAASCSGTSDRSTELTALAAGDTYSAGSCSGTCERSMEPTLLATGDAYTYTAASCSGSSDQSALFATKSSSA